jgi:hypothetical protein
MRRIHNIKTFGGPKVSTKRKISRETRFHGIKGVGAGERIKMKTKVDDVWRTERVHVGWWNYDVWLSKAYMPRWNPELCTEWKQAIKDKNVEYLKGTSGRDVWASGERNVPHGVQELGNKLHIARTSDAYKARHEACVSAEIHIAKTSASTKAYRDQLDAKRQAEALERCKTPKVTKTYVMPTGGAERNMAVSNETHLDRLEAALEAQGLI